MKKDIIVNGRKVAEVGNPMDFVVFHSRSKDREQQHTKSKRDRELEERAQQIWKKYQGSIPDSIFNGFLGLRITK